ncbi:hypothetical protein QBC32DRAFT_65677 [Pseudoneurospora amorphoporcata]|uniref:Uncharacterized protein n=1 Tax=Pseudoneurospora amorphoporcata TaxID=241081 RepID=A0AAN6SC42_9PEZI|nr:hypothetical protein QBC32DRAFT_65677 [Pseudoneurospora amorphoporcata]
MQTYRLTSSWVGDDQRISGVVCFFDFCNSHPFVPGHIQPLFSRSLLLFIFQYLIEIFPYAQIRARGIAIFQFWGKAAQFFGTNVNPIGTQAIGWKYLLVYCCWIFGEAGLIWFLWPETSNRSVEELAFYECP